VIRVDPVRERRALARVACLLLLVFALAVPSPPVHAEPFLPGGGFDQARIAQTVAAALAFMAPRTLDPSSIPQLSLWGLRGLTTIDPKLAAELDPTGLRLFDDAQPVMIRPPPDPDDAAAWGEAVAQMARGAWDASSVIRRAGTQAIITSFFDEVFNHLDPYSRYAPPQEAQEDRDRRRGIAGIGMTAAASRTGFVVASVVPDGPASRAGIRPGEALLAIDGATLQDLDAPAVNEMIAGPPNTQIELRLRDPRGRMRELTLDRVLVPPDTVFATRVGAVLVLRVTGFTSDTAERLGREIAGGVGGPRPAKGVLIDLRGNRGGLLRQAVEAAETLLPTGVIAVTEGRAPGSSHDFVADGRDLSSGLPVVIVVDGRTASAAEILAAGLADEHRAVVVGSSTLGKGLVQTITGLPDGGELSITWSRVLAPLGWPLQGLGVLPQLCTSLGGEVLSREMAELAQGRAPMEAALARHSAARAPLSPGETIDIRNACPAAEGRDADITAARYLVEHPAAYDAALIGPPPPPASAASGDGTASSAP
jgi:carboxyl-terminal processing protease